MSRSRRKTPIVIVCSCRAGVLKDWKKECNRAMRRCPVDAENPKKHEYGDPWSGPHDGKFYSKEWRKNWKRK